MNEGLGADSICDYLNQHGYQKKKVKKNELNYFSRGLIMKILDNPVYIGKIAYGRTATEKVKGSRDQYKRVKTDDYMLIDGIHEAIVDQELCYRGFSDARSVDQDLLEPYGGGRIRNPVSTKTIFITSVCIERRSMIFTFAISDWF